MLDRHKLAQELARVSTDIFSGGTSATWMNVQLWQLLAQDQQFLCNVIEKSAGCYLPTWDGSFSDVVKLVSIPQYYTVLAVDGSQIYPDHHIKGIECFLINTGGCLLSYQKMSSAQLFSQPHVYVPEACEIVSSVVGFSAELVDLLREEHEFKLMVQRACNKQEQSIALFDGNLLCWHLESKSPQVKTTFMQRYGVQFERLYQQRIIHAGYLSASRFRDLCKVLEIGFQNHPLYSDYLNALKTMVDTDLLWSILEPKQRTTVFYSTNPLVEYYATYAKPCFFYLHVGSEIVRVEIPRWIGQDPAFVDTIASICLDQCTKGNGYPVALAEAHAQAVIKNADRDFFYQLLSRFAVTQKQRVTVSPKNLKKRTMNI